MAVQCTENRNSFKATLIISQKFMALKDFRLYFAATLVSGNLGNLEWEYILQIVKGQVRIDFTRLNLARPCRQVSWKTDMGFHLLPCCHVSGFFWFSQLRNPWKPKCLITDVKEVMVSNEGGLGVPSLRK